ncbi:hypothetical protein ASE61_00705 [Bosea sp. Root670]|uniref:phage tail fiber protein n=1 Tax=Bosea sp. Root670 TaxID=1736583 RepID=UPI0007159C55|nr:hypothetical protein [Bosea sp. Root670]KRE08171.1 hypothetical protein ASE61_00705 [Bosea sp. Root670]
MANLTSYARKKLGDHLVGHTAWTMPSPVYLALFTADPGLSGSFAAEVSGGSYARVNISAALSDADTTSGLIVNTTVITFPTPSAGWGVVTHVGLCDAGAAGNLLTRQPLSVARLIVSGDPFMLLEGQIQFSFA